MEADRNQFMHDLLSGRQRGAGSAAFRAVLRAAEAPYSLLMRLRNGLYSRGVLHAHRLPRPVISVGNITAGGTGKTPMVRWLVSELASRGLRAAVLLRGYGRGNQASSDEEALLRGYLTEPLGTIVHAEADRVAGGRAVLQSCPSVDLFVLDDGFQHRRLARDFDLVLVDACNPFGYGHVHPRGLLREPLQGLTRADAFVLTRSDQVPPDERANIESRLRYWNPIAPIYRARHVLRGLRCARTTLAEPPGIALRELHARSFFACAGIASPAALHRQLSAFKGYRGARWYPDHHEFTRDELADVRRQAAAQGASAVVVTEKDWAKLGALEGASEGTPAIWRLEMEIEYDNAAGDGLISLLRARLEAGAEKRLHGRG